MTTLPFTLSVEPNPSIFLFTVRGNLTAPDLEAGRKAHNMVAGSDQAVAMARSFGDLSHAVYSPVPAADKGAGELLIIDYWNSVQGLQSFFANPDVQKGGALVYRDRETVIWQSTPGLPRVALPAPYGRNDRWLGIVRGKVGSREGAEKAMAEAMRRQINTARARGLLSRELYFRATQPGEAESTEMIGVDIWFDADGMRAEYADQAKMAGLATVFAGPPATSIWQKPPGAWVEW